MKLDPKQLLEELFLDAAKKAYPELIITDAMIKESKKSNMSRTPTYTEQQASMVVNAFTHISTLWNISVTRKYNSNLWIIESKIWLDNGHGGRESKLHVESEDLIRAMDEMVVQINIHSDHFSKSYH